MLSIGFWSVNTLIFADLDPEPGGQNLANPTYQMHWFSKLILRLYRIVIFYLVSAAGTTAEGNQDYIEVVNLQATIGTTNTAGANK